MLRSLKDRESYKVSALDGDIGRVTDFLFDDRHFTMRYLVTDTSGLWEGQNQVLVSPISFRQVDWATQLFHVGLTREKLRHSPSADLAKPVSRQYERDYSQYYGWPHYWGYAGVWATGDYPLPLANSSPTEERKQAEAEENDPHLRSAQEVGGYHVRGSDGEIGHIADFIIDDESWTIRYLVIDTNNWWAGKKVLVAPHWAKKVSWSRSKVYLNLTMDTIRNGPAWIPTSPVNREYEERLYDYYGRPAYWPRGDTQPKFNVYPPSSKQMPA